MPQPGPAICEHSPHVPCEHVAFDATQSQVPEDTIDDVTAFHSGHARGADGVVRAAVAAAIALRLEDRHAQSETDAHAWSKFVGATSTHARPLSTVVLSTTHMPLTQLGSASAVQGQSLGRIGRMAWA